MKKENQLKLGIIIALAVIGIIFIVLIVSMTMKKKNNQVNYPNSNNTSEMNDIKNISTMNNVGSNNIVKNPTEIIDKRDPEELAKEYIKYINARDLENLIRLYDMEELGKINENNKLTENDVRRIFSKTFTEHQDFVFEIKELTKVNSQKDIENVMGTPTSEFKRKEQKELLEYSKRYLVYLLKFDLIESGEYLSEDDIELIIMDEKNGKYALAYTGFLDTL